MDPRSQGRLKKTQKNQKENRKSTLVNPKNFLTPHPDKKKSPDRAPKGSKLSKEGKKGVKKQKKILQIESYQPKEKCQIDLKMKLD